MPSAGEPSLQGPQAQNGMQRHKRQALALSGFQPQSSKQLHMVPWKAGPCRSWVLPLGKGTEGAQQHRLTQDHRPLPQKLPPAAALPPDALQHGMYTVWPPFCLANVEGSLLHHCQRQKVRFGTLHSILQKQRVKELWLHA